MDQESLSSKEIIIRKYISLQEATNFCKYSQEYLSLRVRQGKLQGMKLGRNWVTTKEWLEEYLGKNGKNGNGRQPVAPPDNLPIGELPEFRLSFWEKIKSGLSFEDLRPVPLMLLVAVLIMAGGILGKENLKNVSEGIEIFVTEKIGRQEVFVGGASITVGEITKETFSTFGDYSQWVFGQFSLLVRKVQESPFAQSYAKANNFLGEKLGQATQGITQGIRKSYLMLKEGYSIVSQFIGDKLSSLAKKTYQIVKAPFQALYRFTIHTPGVSLTKEELLEIEQKETKKIIEEIQKLIREGISVKETIKEVKQITEVKPVTEITKEISKIDEEALKQLKEQMAYFEEELSKRLYAPGGVINQQIYVTQPVQSPKIYQENGEIVLQTLGSGNVILSAATGLQLYGKQVVIESTDTLSPLVYIASNTRIGGDLTVTGSIRGGDISGGAINGGALTVSSISASGDATVGGNLTVSGNLTISGDITVSGAQNYSGAAVFTASSTSPALKVIQNGTGNIVQFLDGGNDIFIIADGGYATLATSPTASSPAFLFQTSDTINWATGTATFLGINATSTFTGYFLDFQKNGTSLFSIANDGSVTSNATITAASFSSGANDSTVRKSGEEVFREILPISRYDMPAQTGTTTYFRISKYFVQNPLSLTPVPLPGATRVYKLIIKYTDDIPTNSSSSWRIYRSGAAATSDTFVLLGQNASSLAEGIATTTANLTIPDTDWQVEAKLSTDDSGKTLRIFQIFLAAFDRIN